MAFSEALYAALQGAQMTPQDLCGDTGISRSSMSLYLSGKAVPRVEEIVLMERALDKQLPHPDPPSALAPRITVREAAEIMGISQDLLRKGIRQKVFPWAYAVESSPHHFVYIINARRFLEAET